MVTRFTFLIAKWPFSLQSFWLSYGRGCVEGLRWKGEEADRAMDELERDVYGEFPYSFHISWIVDEYLTSFYILYSEKWSEG